MSVGLETQADVEFALVSRILRVPVILPHDPTKLFRMPDPNETPAYLQRQTSIACFHFASQRFHTISDPRGSENRRAVVHSRPSEPNCADRRVDMRTPGEPGPFRLGCSLSAVLPVTDDIPSAD